MMKLSEQIPHEEGCNATYKPLEKPNECDCYVSKVAQLEAHLDAELVAAKNDYARIAALKMEIEAWKETCTYWYKQTQSTYEQLGHSRARCKDLEVALPTIEEQE